MFLPPSNGCVWLSLFGRLLKVDAAEQPSALFVNCFPIIGWRCVPTAYLDLESPSILPLRNNEHLSASIGLSELECASTPLSKGQVVFLQVSVYQTMFVGGGWVLTL